MVGPAPACKRALADATAAFPSRSKASDGIMGDAAHVARCEADPARCEGHVLGNAFDITHDPKAGVDGEQLAELAMTDPRTAYIIWNRRIWSRKREAEGWRPYTGPNPHDKHVHVSIVPEKREDASAWPWSPEAALREAANSATSSASGEMKPAGSQWPVLIAAGLGAAALWNWWK